MDLGAELKDVRIRQDWYGESKDWGRIWLADARYFASSLLPARFQIGWCAKNVPI